MAPPRRFVRHRRAGSSSSCAAISLRPSREYFLASLVPLADPDPNRFISGDDEFQASHGPTRPPHMALPPVPISAPPPPNPLPSSAAASRTTSHPREPIAMAAISNSDAAASCPDLDRRAQWMSSTGRCGRVGGAAGFADDGEEEAVRHGLLGVELGPDDAPLLADRPDSCPVFLKASVQRFEGPEEADDLLFSSFRDIEPMFRNWRW